MMASFAAVVPVLLLVLCLSVQVKGYTYRVKMSTDSGFCEDFKDMKIPLGQTFYDDDICEKYSCDPGVLSAIGCGRVSFVSDDPNCRVVKGKGRYPKCCSYVKCD